MTWRPSSPVVTKLVAAFVAAAAIGFAVGSNFPPSCYESDLRQPYLAARALRDGVDPFTPTDDLASRYFGVETATHFRHASPYPPLLALAFLPLSWVPFPLVALGWLALNVSLLLHVGRRLDLGTLSSLALAAWPPMWGLLTIGQFELIILTILMAAWRADSKQRDVQAGMWLGLAASIKLYPVLFLVPFLLRRRRGVLLGAGLILLLAQMINVAVVGLPNVIHYYAEIVPIREIYVRIGFNAAPYGALLRDFGGASDTAPLFPAPLAVVPLTLIIAALGIFSLAVLPAMAQPLAVLIILPSSWYYYPVLALPQIVTLVRRERYKIAIAIAVAAVSLAFPLVSLAAAALPLTPLGRAYFFDLALTLPPAGLLALVAISLRERLR